MPETKCFHSHSPCFPLNSLLIRRQALLLPLEHGVIGRGLDYVKVKLVKSKHLRRILEMVKMLIPGYSQ